MADYLDVVSLYDQIPGGFAISDTAANISASLNSLDDAKINSITISNNGAVVATVAQLTSDATAIGKLVNANATPYQLAIADTAANVQAGLATLEADVAHITSITATGGPVVVTVSTFSADRGALDKIVGGFAIADTAANVVAGLSTLNADSHVAAITVTSASATLSGGVRVNAAKFSETGAGTSLTVGEALAYAGAFRQGAGSTTAITIGDLLSLTGTTSLSGTTSGAGTLALAGGSATILSGAKLSVSHWSISGSGTDVTLDENLSYAGSFSEGASDTFVLSGGHLLLSGSDKFSGATVDGSKFLYTEGTTTVSGLTIGGTVEWENTKTVTQKGGTVTIGDAHGDKAILYNTPKATYDIADDSGIARGSSTASYIDNTSLIEKTGGTGTSTIAPYVINTGRLEVADGTLDLKEGVYGTGKDQISGAATLEFDFLVKAGQTASFTGRGGELALFDPAGFAGDIRGFDTVGSNDTIEVAAPWVFTGFKENAAHTEGTLGFMNGASTLGLTLIGDYNPADFVHKSGPKGSTLITYT